MLIFFHSRKLRLPLFALYHRQLFCFFLLPPYLRFLNSLSSSFILFELTLFPRRRVSRFPEFQFASITLEFLPDERNDTYVGPACAPMEKGTPRETLTWVIFDLFHFLIPPLPSRPSFVPLHEVGLFHIRPGMGTLKARSMICIFVHVKHQVYYA